MDHHHQPIAEAAFLTLSPKGIFLQRAPFLFYYTSQLSSAVFEVLSIIPFSHLNFPQSRLCRSNKFHAISYSLNSLINVNT